MANFFARRAAAYLNELNASLGDLVGIAKGILCDQQLLDSEVAFLNRWLDQHGAIATTWPGEAIHARVREVLADGLITDEERQHLVATLQQLIGGRLEQLADLTHVTEMAFDEVAKVEFANNCFCLTGDFVFAHRAACEAEIEKRGGIVKSAVSRKVKYVVVGGLGSAEWKHGSFGTKIEKAMQLKHEGTKLMIVQEDCWVRSLT